MKPHSPSSAKTFDTCRRKYRHERILGDVERLEAHPATIAGRKLHGQIEERIKHGTQMRGAGLTWVEEKLLALEAGGFHAGGTHIESELLLGLDRKLRPCGFRYEDVWIRGIADMVVYAPTKTLVVDFKTGAHRPYWLQLEFYALCLLLKSEQVTECRAEFWWTKSKQVDSRVYTRRDIDTLKNTLSAKMLRIEAEREHRPSPGSGLCKSYCGVKQTDCRYRGGPKVKPVFRRKAASRP